MDVTLELDVMKNSMIDDHHVVIAENFGDTNVVGMNFLDSFSSWTVKGDVMELQP